MRDGSKHRWLRSAQPGGLFGNLFEFFDRRRPARVDPGGEVVDVDAARRLLASLDAGQRQRDFAARDLADELQSGSGA